MSKQKVPNRVSLDSLEASVAEALIRWAITQQDIIEESEKQGSCFHWVNLGRIVLDKLERFSAERMKAFEAERVNDEQG